MPGTTQTLPIPPPVSVPTLLNAIRLAAASGGSGGSGTVTSFSFTNGAGISGVVTNPTTTPALALALGAITPTSVNGLTLTAAATGFTIAGGTTSKTLTVQNTLSLAGVDSSVLTIPATGTAALLGTANVFTAAQTISTGSDVATNFKIMNATGATPRVQAGTLATSTAYGALYLGNVTPSGTNYTLISDGSTTYLNSAGTVYITGGSVTNLLYLTSVNCRLLSAQVFDWNADLSLVRKAAATLQLGVDAAGVTNQMFTAASRITSDGVGANLTIAGGNGRGGAGGSLILATYDTGAAATIGTLRSRLVINTAGAFSFPVTTAVTTETVVSDATWPISINGVTYKVCLKA